MKRKNKTETRRRTLLHASTRIYFISIVLASAVAVGCYALTAHDKAVKQVDMGVEQVLQSLGSHLDGNIQLYQMLFFQYLIDDNMQSFFSYVNGNEISKENREGYSEYFRRSMKYRNAVLQMSVLFSDDIRDLGFVPHAHNVHTIFEMGREYYNVEMVSLTDEEELLLEQVRQLPLGKTLVFSNMIGLGVSENGFTICRRINKVENGSTLGYFFVQISDHFFQSISSNLELTPGRCLFFRFPDGEIACQITDEGLRQGTGIEPVSEKDYHILDTQTESGFTIQYWIPWREFAGEISGIYLWILAAFVVASLISYILFIRLFQKNTAYVKKIVSFANTYRVDQEANDLCPEDTDISEFQVISESLNEMQQRNRQLLEDKYMLTISQQEAEYQALQAEINPHFLNNVISSFIALNRLGKTKRLEQMMVELSKMYRYSCEHTHYTDIYGECRFLISYLRLEELRFEEDLSYEFEIDDEAGAVEIPRMLLQPLVENAMKHGFTSGVKMRLRIQAIRWEEQGGDWILIRVANSGKPVNREKIKASRGIGLVNVAERLRLNYKRSCFWFSVESDYGTIANLLFDIRQRRSRDAAVEEDAVQKEERKCVY